MKKKHIFIFLICIVMIFTSIPLNASAHDAKEHNAYMSEVLFKNFKDISSDKEGKDKVKLLEAACYLTIDQFNDSGKKDLELLNNSGVKNIPQSISEISFSASPNQHRSYTHRGWDYAYTGDMKQIWPIRKDILLNTSVAVFNFDSPKQQDAFCRILYNIHILDDHSADKSYMVSSKNGLKIAVGGRTDEIDIIHQLIEDVSIVFEGQKNTHKYRSLTARLNLLNFKFSKIVSSEGGVNSEEKFVKHQKYVDETKKLLTLYLPEMLKDEPFFNEAFY